ncbi:MAG: hypothetical protein WB510_04130 [Candidatus Sulfotelmatobacter sp.]
MRSRLILFTLSFYLTLVVLGCTSKPSSDNTSNTTGASNTSANSNTGTSAKTPEPARKQPLVVPSGATVTVSLGAALGSKLSQSGQSFSGTVAKDVLVDNTVAIPQGANVTGTVVDAKALGRFAGGAVLQIRLDSINVNGSDLPVQASARSFAVKGKGKRTGIMAGGGAALGGIIGGIAGGGKGAAIGLLAGGGAGGAGAAFTGNKDIVLPAESAVSFQLTQSLEIKQ